MGERLQNRVCAVTGAGAGIGRAIALRFASEGASVVVSDRVAEAAEATAHAITEQGGRALSMACDVADEEQVHALIERTVSELGALHVLVNNAAMVRHAPVAETPTKQWKKSLAVTLDGTFFGVRAALAVMNKQGSGSIINISSGAGLAGEPNHNAYGAAKAAVLNLTKLAAVENARHGVRINSICPGPIDTETLRWALDQRPGGLQGFVDQIPAQRLGRVEDVANAALFLASDEATYVNGAVLTVDGGIAARSGAPR